jgi:hypothetical protein
MPIKGSMTLSTKPHVTSHAGEKRVHDAHSDPPGGGVPSSRRSGAGARLQTAAALAAAASAIHRPNRFRIGAWEMEALLQRRTIF